MISPFKPHKNRSAGPEPAIDLAYANVEGMPAYRRPSSFGSAEVLPPRQPSPVFVSRAVRDAYERGCSGMALDHETLPSFDLALYDSVKEAHLRGLRGQPLGPESLPRDGGQYIGPPPSSPTQQGDSEQHGPAEGEEKGEPARFDNEADDEADDELFGNKKTKTGGRGNKSKRRDNTTSSSNKPRRCRLVSKASSLACRFVVESCSCCWFLLASAAKASGHWFCLHCCSTMGAHCISTEDFLQAVRDLPVDDELLGLQGMQGGIMRGGSGGGEGAVGGGISVPALRHGPPPPSTSTSAAAASGAAVVAMGAVAGSAARGGEAAGEEGGAAGARGGGTSSWSSSSSASSSSSSWRRGGRRRAGDVFTKRHKKQLVAFVLQPMAAKLESVGAWDRIHKVARATILFLLLLHLVLTPMVATAVPSPDTASQLASAASRGDQELFTSAAGASKGASERSGAAWFVVASSLIVAGLYASVEGLQLDRRIRLGWGCIQDTQQLLVQFIHLSGPFHRMRHGTAFPLLLHASATLHHAHDVAWAGGRHPAGSSSAVGVTAALYEQRLQLQKIATSYGGGGGRGGAETGDSADGEEGGPTDSDGGGSGRPRWWRGGGGTGGGAGGDNLLVRQWEVQQMRQQEDAQRKQRRAKREGGGRGAAVEPARSSANEGGEERRNRRQEEEEEEEEEVGQQQHGGDGREMVGGINPGDPAAAAAGEEGPTLLAALQEKYVAHHLSQRQHQASPKGSEQGGTPLARAMEQQRGGVPAHVHGEERNNPGGWPSPGNSPQRVKLHPIPGV